VKRIKISDFLSFFLYFFLSFFISFFSLFIYLFIYFIRSFFLSFFLSFLLSFFLSFFLSSFVLWNMQVNIILSTSRIFCNMCRQYGMDGTKNIGYCLCGFLTFSFICSVMHDTSLQNKNIHNITWYSSGEYCFLSPHNAMNWLQFYWSQSVSEFL